MIIPSKGIQILFQFRLIFLLPFLLLLSCTPEESGQNELVSEPLPVPTFKRMSQEQYGVQVGSHEVIQDSFPEDQLLVDLLQSHGVARDLIDTIDARASEGFDTRNMKAGNPYTILKSTESGEVDFFMYEEDDENFVVIDLREGVDISRGNQPVETEIRAAFLPITSNLYEVARDNNVDVAIVKSIEEIFARDIDFRKNDIGDKCQVLFEERYVDGRYIGVGRVLAATFQQGDTLFNAFLYEIQDSVSLYYDENGLAVNQPFLPYLTADTSKHLGDSWQRKLKAYEVSLEEESPVPSILSGTISAIEGSSVDISHREISRISYLGLGIVQDSLTVGDEISRGEIIGMTRSEKDSPLLILYSQNGKQMQIPFSGSYLHSSAAPFEVVQKEDFKRHIRTYLKALDSALPNT